MTNLGLPVPPGFTITTEACRYYLAQGATPGGLDDEVSSHLHALEQTMGRKLGDPADPLLVSVRSGAKFSMPGMMDTVLNIGLSDESVDGLAKQSGNERFAWDAYRRLIQMFGKTVLDIDGEQFEHAIDAAKNAKGVASDTELTAEDLKALTATYKELVREHAGREFPQDPREQMDLAVVAVFNSWNSARAVLYRRQERIPADLGTAVSVVAMVFGNLGDDSGTGVAFTRDPGTGAQGVYGDYLQNAQGEDVVAGIRNTVPLQDLERIDKTSYDQLMTIMQTLENHYRDLCDIEFTIERGKLWMLQTRVGKRTAAAAFRIAVQRRGASKADVPPLRRVGRGHADHQGDLRLAGRGRRQGRVRLADRRRLGRGGREGHPRPSRDQPGRPARHDRRRGRTHQPRRQDQPRGRRRAWHGQDLRLRRGRPGSRHGGQEFHDVGRRHGERGRRDLGRRDLGRGVPGRGAGDRV
jgi:pyruvate,phosphate dikinase